MEETNCFFCGTKCDELPKHGAADGYNCMYCGMYEITYATLSDEEPRSKIDENKHIFAGYLEETKDSSFREKIITIDKDKIEDILNDRLVPKTTMQKLEKLLIYCSKITEQIAEEFIINYDYYRFSINYDGIKRISINKEQNRIGVSYSKNTIELYALINALVELGWIKEKLTLDNKYIICYSLTAKGLQYAEQLLTTNIASNKVLIATEFSKGYEKRRDNAIKPACAACGFEAFTVNEDEFNGDIVDKIITGIKTSKFIIVDLTYDNSGAYYEAGYAAGLGLEVIKCCQQKWFDDKKNKVHFDLNHDKLILYSDNNYDDFAQKLKMRIRATINGAILEDK